MKFIVIFGPQAVGKMTVGHELEKITKLKLFHNHMTIELVSNYFDYGTPTGKRLVRLFREEIFKAVAESELDGLIFTYLWYFDQQGDQDYIENVTKIFRNKGTEIYYIELEADIEERLKRNKTEHRLEHKPSKRNIEWSEGQVKDAQENHRSNSSEGEIQEKNYLRINTDNISPAETALLIKDKFNLK
jgi:hypothetical protein